MGIQTNQRAQQTTATSELRKEAGLWLKAIRSDLGVSQRTLAERVNMEYYTFISQIEAGRGRIPAERLQDWAIALEMDPAVFAKKLMQYYDPFTYDLVFGAKD
ncbi:helix-turn-helix domain-containing protein [Rhodospirillaceae bacterium]|nr:helix-turn-helix domain-containing protein [Rhodospirillaceae bacterium]